MLLEILHVVRTLLCRRRATVPEACTQSTDAYYPTERAACPIGDVRSQG